MKIGIDASRANSSQKTGVETYAFCIIQEFKKIVPDTVEVILYTREKLQGELAELPKNWKEKVLHWPPKRLWTQVRLSFEMLFHAPDILFVPAHVPPLIHPKKTVMTIHDVAALRFPKSYNWFERWYSVWSAKWAMKKMWKIVVPSGFVRDQLLVISNQQSVLKKVQAVHHGYSGAYKKIEDQKKTDRVLGKYNITRPFLLSIGRLEEKKNTKRVITAFSILKSQSSELLPTGQAGRTPNLSLVLVGKPGHGYDDVEKAINNSTQKQSIICPGFVEEADLPYLLNAAELFVFPSLYEGFGIPMVQAFACGTPVLASQGSSLEEIGGEAAHYVDPLSTKSIAHGMKTVLDDKQLRLSLVEVGMQRAKDFSWEESAKRTLSVLLSK